MQDIQLTPFRLTTDLPETLSFTGEFGAEINSFLPFIYWLHLAGLMQGRRISTYCGMRPFYFFLDPQAIIERPDKRRYVLPAERPRWLPTRNDHHSQRNAFEVFPDFRRQYRNTLFDADKPLLVIHNKFTREWDRPPVNFLGLPVLRRMFTGLAPYFTLVYTRPGIGEKPAGFSDDQQDDAMLDDLSLVRRHGDVLLLEDVARAMQRDLSYNEVKLRLYASTHFHLTVQGGNAHLASLFSGSLIGILHRFGQEIIHSYAAGHFQYGSNPRPDYLICRTEDELALALDVFVGSRMCAERVMLPAGTADITDALSPATQGGASRMSPLEALCGT